MLQNGRVYFTPAILSMAATAVAPGEYIARRRGSEAGKAISATLPGVGGQWRNCMSGVGGCFVLQRHE